MSLGLCTKRKKELICLGQEDRQSISLTLPVPYERLKEDRLQVCPGGASAPLFALSGTADSSCSAGLLCAFEYVLELHHAFFLPSPQNCYTKVGRAGDKSELWSE